MKGLSEEERDALDWHVQETYLRLAEPFPNVRLNRSPRYASVMSSLQHPIGNFAIGFRFDSMEQAKRELDALLFGYREAGCRARVWITGRETPPNCSRLLRAAGLFEAFSLEQMALRLPFVTPAASAIPGRFAVERDEASALADFWIDQFFHSTDFGVREVLAPIMAEATWRLIQDDQGAAYYFQEGPSIVGAALLVRSGGIAGVYSVATNRDYRRRGLATAATKVLLNVASEAGCKLATLQATEGSKRLYLKLGFRAFSPLRCFVE